MDVSEVRHHTVQVPATTANVGAGFDSFGLALDRHLLVRSVPRDQQDDRVEVLDDVDVPSDDDNLIWRSFVAFCTRHDVEVPDIGLVVRSEIPLERGLGSSSSAIVAGLTLAREITGVRTGDREVVALATELEGHPDNVAPAVLGGLVACARDDDGILVIRRVNPTPALRPVLFIPELRQSTKAARAVLPASLPREDVASQAARAGHVLAALVGTWPAAPALGGDLLHEPSRLEVMPAAGALLAALRGRGVHAWLSGAGPTIAGAVPAGHEGALEELSALADAHEVALVPSTFDLSGARGCSECGCGLSGAEGCPHCPRRRL